MYKIHFFYEHSLVWVKNYFTKNYSKLKTNIAYDMFAFYRLIFSMKIHIGEGHIHNSMIFLKFLAALVVIHKFEVVKKYLVNYLLTIYYL